MSVPTNLGRLEKIDLRQAWTHEAHSFTPWLALEENLKLLSETVQMDLVLEAQEQSVGPFRADLLCRIEGNPDHWVLIENQIERTDHTHLGQLITYAAGLHAVTIVWVAGRFTDEHRAALDWLNEVTGENISFFGLEIELWRIGESNMAPKFNVICKPNEWVKLGGIAKDQASGNNQTFYREYWDTFVASCAGKHPLFGRARRSDANWISWSAGKGYGYGALISRRDHYVRVRVWSGGSKAKSLYDALEPHQSQIDPQLPGLKWRRRDEAVESYIDLSWNDQDPDDRSLWASQHEWLFANLVKLQAVFDPVIKSLP